MEAIRLEVEMRQADGKGAARKLRASGNIPANIYGLGRPNVNVQLQPSDIQNLLRQPCRFNTVVELIAGDATQLAIVRDVQRDPVSKAILHVDLLRVDENSRIIVEVPLKRVGRSKGEQEGGRLLQQQRKIKVRCKPIDVPAAIEFDVSKLVVGDKVFVDKLTLPEGLEAVYKQRFPVFIHVGSRVMAGALADEEPEEGAEESAEAAAEAPAE